MAALQAPFPCLWCTSVAGNSSNCEPANSKQQQWTFSSAPLHAQSFGGGERLRNRGIRAGPAAASKQGSPELDVGAYGAVVSDDKVPEGHKGLHSFLYGESGADVHDSAASFQVRGGEDEGAVVVPVADWLSGREKQKPPGVYAVYSSREKLEYIGYSRNVVLSLKQHLARVGEDRCALVRVKVYAKAALVSRAGLEQERQSWLQQYGTPLGNAAESNLWEASSGRSSAMSEAEKTEYEEQKLKMRKAMGENLYDAVEGEAEDSKQRRLRLLAATEGDDWSAVIDGQTQLTVEAKEAQEPPQIVSPFAQRGAGQASSTASEVALLDLTAENVDLVLNEVRPYLIADGGNVEVVGVEDGIVALRLQGACGTCPSSTSTMKMGIERSLQAKFGDALKEVVQVDKIDTSASLESVNSHLDLLRPAIINYGGSLEVLRVDKNEGVCEVRYKGPPPIGMGIKAAIKDRFPDIKTVEFVDE